MTYRELIEYCSNLGFNACDHCECSKECDRFLKIVGYVPKHYMKFCTLDLDREIIKDEIIRCKDCRYFYKNDLDEWDCKYLGHINALTPNNFCSAGTKKG